jgi:GxxExxY protein
MESNPEGLKHRELTEKIIGVFYDVYNELGHGFLETIYEQALAIVLAQAGMKVERQVGVSVWFRSQQVGDFRADMRVDGKVLLELSRSRYRSGA